MFWLFAAVFIAMTWPAAFASAPPESPSAIEAFDWNMFVSRSDVPEPASLAVMARFSAVIVPLVTVGWPPVPPAFPIATTGSPSRTLLESPTWTVFSPDTFCPDGPVSCNSATSWALSVPTTLALYFWAFPISRTCTRVEPLMTWLLVSTMPLEDSTMPVPSKTSRW